MWKHLKSRSRYAKAWLMGAAGIQLTLFAVAQLNPGLKLYGFGEWGNRELMVLAAIAWLLISALLMHGFDRKAHGCGFQDVYRSDPRGAHQKQEQLFIAPVLSVESVRAAMTAVILAILLENRKDYVPPPEIPFLHSVGTVARDPDAVFFLLVTGALASSLIFTMAALLCYEYAVRFAWPTDDWRKKDLLDKGFHFGKAGFYCLMWSLAVVPGLLDYRLAFISTFFVFVVMWLYYFFPTAPTPPQPAAGEPAADPLPAADPANAEAVPADAAMDGG